MRNTIGTNTRAIHHANALTREEIIKWTTIDQVESIEFSSKRNIKFFKENPEEVSGIVRGICSAIWITAADKLDVKNTTFS